MKRLFTFLILSFFIAYNSLSQTSNNWVSGSNSRNQNGIYGIQGTGSTSNIPGARYSSISWTENDTLWFFGGEGYDGNGNYGYLNDLWKYNKVNGQWTWVIGSNSVNQQGTYGTQGVGSASNIPGARSGSISWTENDTLWLFGGYGKDGSGMSGALNDLWKYNKINGQWTWVSGSNSINQNGIYGTSGVGSTSNSPGARYSSNSWVENDILWLFGGAGYDGVGSTGLLNDLWKYDKTNGQWTWVSGSNNTYQQGTYGTQGIGSNSNIPGARYSSISWTENDTLWLFGGQGNDGNGVVGFLNDLWKYNKTNGQWTWVNGSNSRYQQGTYGTQGVGSPSNIPGARYGSIGWTESDTLWLFGGAGLDGSSNSGYLNDLWKYNKTNGQWTWVNGSNSRNQQGAYGTQGTGSTSNIPGGRYASIRWTENNTLWLFGGEGLDGSGNSGLLNDLWTLSLNNCIAANITQEPSNASLCAGGNVLFGLTAAGTNIDYQWQRDSAGTWVNLINETNDTLYLSSVADSMNGFSYRCVVITTCGNDTSAVRTLTVHRLTNIITEPMNDTICDGGAYLISGIIVGHNLNYIWQTDSGGGSGNMKNLTVNNDTLTAFNVPYSSNGWLYRLIATGTCNNDTASFDTLTIWANPDIISISSSLNPSYNSIYQPLKCSNLTATTNGGTGSYSYGWTPSGTGNPLNVCPTIGTWYTVTVTDVNNCTDTMSIKQSVMEATSPYPGRVLICYQYPRRPNYYTLNVLPTQVTYYMGLGATLGACGSVPSKRSGSDFAELEGLYKVYPNPFSNELNLEFFNMFTEEVNITLTDMTGRVVKTIYNGMVYEGELSRMNVDATNLSNGMYLVRYSSNSDVRINKVQLMR